MTKQTDIVVSLRRRADDGALDGWASPIYAKAADEIERLRAHVADLEAANDAAEREVGYGNGDLWRFWRDKALATVDKEPK